MNKILSRRNLKLDTIDKVAEILKIIGHPTRLHVLLALEEKTEMTVTELLESLPEKTEQSLLSHHLIKMKANKVLKSQKRGMCVYYQIADTQILKIFDCIEKCEF